MGYLYSRLKELCGDALSLKRLLESKDYNYRKLAKT